MPQLYHTFPRRQGNDVKKKGLVVLESILQNGLLLTPELFQFAEAKLNGAIDPILVSQKRVCFTELSETELSDHGKVFGPISMEWDLNQLKLAHVCPVFYVPHDANSAVWDSAIGTMLARFAEIQSFLAFLDKFNMYYATLQDKNQTIKITRNGKDDYTSPITFNQMHQFLDSIFQDKRPVTELLGAVKAMGCIFYPVENLQFTKELAFYHQKEWRIIYGILEAGKDICSIPNDQEKETLISLDQDFFLKEKKFPDGVKRIVDECRFLKSIRGTPIANTIKRIIAPIDYIDSIRHLLKRYNLEIPISLLP
jgi:hypothetical protein